MIPANGRPEGGTASRRKFVIVNNGMTEARGHYVETALSVAEEACRRGFDVYLAVHEACILPPMPAGITPLPFFRVDHWGANVRSTLSNAEGLVLDLATSRSAGINDVRQGRAAVRAYLSARFKSETTVAAKPSQKRPFMAALVPPLFSTVFSHLYERRRPVKRLFWTAVWYITPPVLMDAFGRARTRVREHKHRRRARRAAMAVTAPAGKAQPTASSLRPELAEALQTVGGPRELEFHDLFKADLERILVLIGAGPDDIVFHPTAHAREALAVRDLVETSGAASLPSFHLEFRHAVLPDPSTEKGAPLYPYSAIHEAFFDVYAALPECPRIHLYTDTQELSHDYAQLARRPFAVLPIPFRARLMPEKVGHDLPLVALFSGDPREEKGFCLLPSLIDALKKDHVDTGKLRFVIQAGIHADARNDRMLETLQRLEAFGDDKVELVGKSGFVPETEYYSHLAGADIVLLPYDAETYRARSSGVLAEAVAAGKPVIAPARTWLSSQLSEGAGEIFASEADLAQALRRICDDYATYRARALSVRNDWLRHHSPEGLISALVAADAMVRASGGAQASRAKR